MRLSELPSFTTHSLILPERLYEKDGLSVLGGLRPDSTNSKMFEIDFSKTTWADPLPLLMIANIIANTNTTDKIFVKLGPDNNLFNHEKKVFLKFLASQGFLDILSHNAILKWKDEPVHIDAIKEYFQSYSKDVNYRNADFIWAQIENVKTFLDHNGNVQDDELQRYVEKIVTAAKAVAIGSAFGSVQFARDRLFQKIRKILYELCLNVIEHAYPESKSGFFGIYGRIRGGRPKYDKEAYKWNILYDRERTLKRVPTLNQFTPNKYSDWLELFICDSGVGMLYYLNEMNINKNLKKKISNSKNPFRTLGENLFIEALSRFPRKANNSTSFNRTNVTGLVHLGQMFQIDGDYSRVYCKGEWLGNTHPWKVGLRHGQLSTFDQNEYAQYRYSQGMCYAIHIQPALQGVDYPDDKWLVSNNKTRNQIINSLSNPILLSYNKNYILCDRRTLDHCRIPQIDGEELSNGAHLNSNGIVILRPPRLLAKQHLSTWFQDIFGMYGTNIIKGWRAQTFILAELSPFQALSIAELIKLVKVSKKSTLKIYLVSEDWSVSCLVSAYGKTSFDFSMIECKKFANYSKKYFNIVDLALCLREVDSKIFWKDQPNQKINSVFRNEKINWGKHSSKSNKTIDGYLDLSQALAEPNRYRAARRSLKRSLRLFEATKINWSDSLIETLCEELQDLIWQAVSSIDEPEHNVLVGSICVSGRTMDLYSQKMGACYKGKIYLLAHSNANVTDINIHEPIFALLWLQPKYFHHYKKSDYERIPNTPFIAKGGLKSISIVRFKKNDSGEIDFNRSHYGRSPQQTYDDFDRLECLKIGHWIYNNRHDLITVNLSRAFNLSILGKGNLLNWMHDIFNNIFGTDKNRTKPLADILLYPSHPVTDQIMDYIKSDRYFLQVLPKSGVFPIRSVSHCTVSPLLFSPTIRERILKELSNNDLFESRSWSAAIFDDGIISGKHLREVKQFLQELGALKVYSIAILDRSGLPVNDAVMEKFTSDHHRYWRLDIPTMGNSRDCILCAALARLMSFKSTIESGLQRKRLNDICFLWAPRNVSPYWQRFGVKPRELKNQTSVTFGLASQKDGTVVGNEVSIRNSTSLASIMLELTRLTTRYDLPIRDYQDRPERQEDMVRIERITSELFLFYDELSYWDKCEIYLQLLQILNKYQSVNNLTALACLAIATIDGDLAEEVWDKSKHEISTPGGLQNWDAVLAFKYIWWVLRRSFKDEKDFQKHKNGISAHNKIIIGLQGEYKDHIARLFKLIGIGRPLSHKSVLRSVLLNIKNGKINELSIYKATLLYEVLYECLKDIENSIPWTILSFPIKFKDILHRMNNDIEKYQPLNENMQVEYNKAQKWGGLFYNFVYKDKGLEHTFTNNFVKVLKKDEKHFNLVSTIISELYAEWDYYLNSKKTDFIYGKWCNSGIIKKPVIKCFNDKRWPETFYLYFDSLVKDAMKDAFLNVCHAYHEVEFPMRYQNSNPGSANMWWGVRNNIDKELHLELINVSENRNFSVKPTDKIEGLYRVGGHINTKAVNKKINGFYIIKTIISIPLISSL